ncbi:hypothetical protein [Neptunicella sp. SCSIO 80796]|uniref:hypothetical protein n=1 Tax=Neptunicella plasticusilytica TaxID=3117012 RepID=UPI003A4DE6F4
MKNLAMPLLAGLLGAAPSSYLGVAVGENATIKSIESRFASINEKFKYIDAISTQATTNKVEMEAYKRLLARVELQAERMRTEINQIKIDMAKKGL